MYVVGAKHKTIILINFTAISLNHVTELTSAKLHDAVDVIMSDYCFSMKHMTTLRLAVESPSTGRNWSSFIGLWRCELDLKRFSHGEASLVSHANTKDAIDDDADGEM